MTNASVRPRFDHSDQDLAQHDGSAFSLAPQAHGQPSVFDHDQHEQCPYDQGDDAVDIFLGRFGEGDDNGERIDWAGADVSKHQSQGLDDAAPSRNHVLLVSWFASSKNSCGADRANKKTPACAGGSNHCRALPSAYEVS